MPGQIKNLFAGMIVFLAVIVGLTSIHQDMNQRHGLSNPDTVEVRDEFNELEQTIKSDSNETTGIYERAKTLTRPLDDIGATLAAGLYVMPQIGQLLFAPVSIFYSVVDSTVGAIEWIPGWVADGVKLVFTTSLLFGIIGAWMRWRT